MPVFRDKIVKFCEKYLEVDKFRDYCVNGLQVEGSEKVSRIITGVSLSQDLIERAVEKRAEMIIVHHGLFGSDFSPLPKITGYMKNRLAIILENNINLCGFHLPLDAHSKVGNNANLARVLGLKKIKVLGRSDGEDIGYYGELETKMTNEKFVALVDRKLTTKSYSVLASKTGVKKVGIISGGAARNYEDAYDIGMDTYITGEICETSVRRVEEMEKNYISAGHYNTEKIGVQKLGELLAKRFAVKVEFVDIPCEI